MKIYHLPPQLIAKIAAGEVIERPAFAVKELIENAIDAGADEISIVIEDAGLKKIQVSDNGEGMSPEDLQESIKPHTTSKIVDENLTGIKTLGFRGEALASLAAVSALTIKSRPNYDLPSTGGVAASRGGYSKETNQPTGTQIIAEHGKLLETSPVGMAPGTVVIAEDLFANVPARKKFLKTPQTEFRHITDIVTRFAASFPHIRFTLIHNKRIILDAPKTQQNIERIKYLAGEETFAAFLPVQATDTYITLSGFITKPQIHASSQSKQFLFINNRQVSDKLISLAVKESYGTMLEPTAYPIFVLFITTPPEMVDINVHPRKEHIQFINSKAMFAVVKTAVMQTLQDNNITFQNLSWKRGGVGTTNTFAAELLKENILEKETLFPQKNTTLMQMHRLYIAAETKNGFLVFDQHAAHERIVFEKLLKEFQKQSKKHHPHPLKDAVTLTVSNNEQMLIAEHQNLFEGIGFRFSQKQNTKITHMPFLLQDRNPQELIKNLLSYLEQDIPLPSVDAISIEMLSFLACRAAVKAGDKLEEKQMRKIIHDLETTPNNATCPHGRPTRILYSLNELNKNFKR